MAHTPWDILNRVRGGGLTGKFRLYLSKIIKWRRGSDKKKEVLHDISILKIEAKSIKVYVRRGVQRLINYKIKWRRGVWNKKNKSETECQRVFLSAPAWNSPKVYLCTDTIKVFTYNHLSLFNYIQFFPQHIPFKLIHRLATHFMPSNSYID